MRSATSRCSISVASAMRAARLELEQAKQNRRRDVVGKIAGDANRAPRLGGSAASRSISSTSPDTIDAFDGSLGVSSAMRSRSISMATRRDTLGASLQRENPRPGPISRNRSSGAGAMASTTLSAQTGSRKCCPKRLRVRMAFTGRRGFVPRARNQRAIKIAIVADNALVAERLRFADAPPVQDQRIGGFRPLGRRQRARRAAASTSTGSSDDSDADAIRDAQDVAIDRQAGNAQRMAEHDVRCLASDARKLDERLHRVRHLAGVIVRRARAPCPSTISPSTGRSLSNESAAPALRRCALASAAAFG